ncbi:ferritin-like domain-containing protein [Silvibacterium acidisoli]|uniref:ferritin-like domain-containing protein n=1 Tax=Acidobacteriaceae bacterium ZG23-2 TaxID=2883246 RepID=UPI00406CE256
MQNTTHLPVNPATNPLNRRSLLKHGLLAGGAAATLAATNAFSQSQSLFELDRGDIAILRFLAAAELLESDLWTQYAELGGVTDGAQSTYQQALSFLDGDGSQYITSNTIDEVSHANFLNAYLESAGADPVNLDAFRTLKGSTATGAADVPRLTNLLHLNVDTSWYIRYRSTTNPDTGATYPQAITIHNRPAIPATDSDFENANHIQAIANTAAFHFGSIEQGGTSLYASLSQKVTHAQVLEITLGIGGDEIAHFLEWVDFAGNAVQPGGPNGDQFNFEGSTTPVTDKGLTFPDFTKKGPLFQPNLIFPVPSEFVSSRLPRCAVIRPITYRFGGARAAVAALTASGLFTGQSKQFFSAVQAMANAADAAIRGV